MNPKRYAEATQRNRQPILNVFLKVLPSQGNILEIASGTGEHAVFFSSYVAPRHWYPSEPDPELRASIKAWEIDNPRENLHSPLDIDASKSYWEIEEKKLQISTIVNINMIHITPWSTCLGLMRGANRILPSDGILYLYGPYRRNGEHTAPSNQAFDQSLRSRNSQWGIRNLEDVVEAADQENLKLQEIMEMPANNLSVIFRKKS